MGRSFKIILLLFCLFLAKWMAAQNGQINIPRITSMPDQPSPYNMRDWKRVAMKYDSFIYDKNKSGQYLPLVSYTANGINLSLIHISTIVKGVVTETNGSPMIGVSIAEKNTTNGTITDIDGSYSLKVNSTASVLVLSLIHIYPMDAK